MKLPKQVLFGYDTNGNVKQWSIEVKDGNGFFTIKHGRRGGKMTVKDTPCKRKNVGRANETSANEQAIKEAKARYQKQLDKGYAPNLEEATEVKNPMLAHDYRKQGHRIDYEDEAGVFVQPKLDGVRCEIYKDETGTIIYKSRGGKFYPIIEHISRDLEPLFKYCPDMKLDGELYIHGYFLQEIVSAVKKPNESTPKLEFRCFDIASSELTWKSRRKILMELGKHFTTEHILFAGDVQVKSEEEMKEYHSYYVAQGYEGIMIRQGHGVYKYNHRSPWLQKYKEFKDEEFAIIDVEEDNEGFGVPVCICEGGEFKATFKATHAERAALLVNKHAVIGKHATVKYQALTKDGIPQFPVCVAIRDYE